jgi:NhaP-type Na+/H+ or K+/H+ antiporter
MGGNRWTFEDWIGLGVRLFFGALLGVFVGVSWVWFLSPFDSAAANWGIFAAAVVLCAVLAARFGDAFWASLKHWTDWT